MGGIGKVTEKMLGALGVNTCGDVLVHATKLYRCVLSSGSNSTLTQLSLSCRAFSTINFEFMLRTPLAVER